MFHRLNTLLPRSLYGRAALILIVPIVTIQLVVSIGFIQRHFEKVTRQMSEGVAIELSLLLADVEAGDGAQAAALARGLKMELSIPADWQATRDARRVWDLSGRAMIATLREALPGLIAADLLSDDRSVRLLITSERGPFSVTLDRRRVSATNPHQLLVLMIFTSVLMTLIAYQFLRNQLRPI
ncbi:MAG: two-component sensor histidine kinase, partial [Paracoccaceae bacterium]|nr:two-component sensor histidine kinase [Paracoccaceae bacterium]